jgi:L-amino acid N-acyltransferase YncA
MIINQNFIQNIMIREMSESDGERVLEIYKMGIETGNATFETEVPTWNDWDSKHLPHSRFVSAINGKIVGWAALSPVSARSAYIGVAEISIYVDTGFIGKGIGSPLMERVVQSSEEKGIWTLTSSVFPENSATLRLHEKFRFRIIGVREKIARLGGKWRNTILLERRSKNPKFG